MQYKCTIAILCTMLIPAFIYAQRWQRQDILNEISVEIPGNFEKTKINSSLLSYDFTSECCLFSVGVTLNAIESYNQYRNLSDAERKKFLDVFLNNVITGIIVEGKQHLISASNRELGQLFIKEVVFSDIDIKLKGSRKRYAALILINNNLYTFSCWYLDDKLHEMERKLFFQSIRIK